MTNNEDKDLTNAISRNDLYEEYETQVGILVGEYTNSIMSGKDLDVGYSNLMEGLDSEHFKFRRKFEDQIRKEVEIEESKKQ